MILSDTDILSALAKVERLDLLYQLLQIDTLYVVPAVLAELQAARTRQHPFAFLIFDLIEHRKITTVAVTAIEAAFAARLPNSLGAGERESMAVAHERQWVLLSNEGRVAYWNRQYGISYLNLAMLLRAAWMETILSQQEVHALIADLYTHDRMTFSAKTLAAIFSQ